MESAASTSSARVAIWSAALMLEAAPPLSAPASAATTCVAVVGSAATLLLESRDVAWLDIVADAGGANGSTRTCESEQQHGVILVRKEGLSPHDKHKHGLILVRNKGLSPLDKDNMW